MTGRSFILAAGTAERRCAVSADPHGLQLLLANPTGRGCPWHCQIPQTAAAVVPDPPPNLPETQAGTVPSGDGQPQRRYVSLQ